MTTRLKKRVFLTTSSILLTICSYSVSAVDLYATGLYGVDSNPHKLMEVLHYEEYPHEEVS